MSARSRRVPAIAGTADEELLYELLRELAAHLSQGLADDGIRHGFIGGTALKIGYGLTRPSTDLDVKVETPRDFTTHIERAFEQITGWSYREPTDDEWNQGAEGIIVRHVETGRTLGTRIDFVPGRLHDTDTASIDERQLEEHHGVRMFSLPDLAQYKLNALIGREARKRPRDVYDAAWLMEHWPDAIDAPTKTKLVAWHRSITTEPALYAEWEEEFGSSNVGSRIPLSTLVSCLGGASRGRTRDRATRRCTRNNSGRRIAFAQPEEDQRARQPAPTGPRNHGPAAGTKTAGNADELAGCAERGGFDRSRIYIDRDRGAPHGATPPTPPGIRVRTTAVRPD